MTYEKAFGMLLPELNNELKKHNLQDCFDYREAVLGSDDFAGYETDDNMVIVRIED